VRTIQLALLTIALAATTPCPTTGVACKCEETWGGARLVTFQPSADQCASCTGTCKKVIP
jgi:hypothetical protein